MASTFLGGFNEAAENQRENVFALKAKSALMQQQLEQQQNLFDYQKASPEVGDTIFSSLGVNPDGKRRSVQELGLLDQLYKSKISAEARAQSMAKNGMTVSELENALGIDTGIKDKSRWMSPAEASMWKARTQSDTPTAEVKNSYLQQQSGLKLLDQLEKMRKDALDEVYSGPFAGRAANLAVAADQGKLFPKAKAYVDFSKANLAHLAHFSGEVGRLAEGDIDRAAPLAPDFKTADEAAGLVFDAARENARNSMDTAEKLFGGLRRMRAMESTGNGLRSQAEKTTSVDPAEEARKFAAWYHKRKAAEAMTKNAGKVK